jgi:hypothetical protein
MTESEFDAEIERLPVIAINGKIYATYILDISADIFLDWPRQADAMTRV